MFKKILATLLACLIAIGLSLSAALPASAGGGKGGGDDDNVPVCHWTPGQGGKYVHLLIDDDGVLGDDDSDGNGHDGHEKDIIPPFDGYAGKNLSSVPGGGSAADFAAAGCNILVTPSVTITPATCDAPEMLVLNALTGVEWKTPTRTSGPGAYEVRAKATDGYAFAGGSDSKKFTGTLADKLPATDPSCAVSNSELYGVGLYIYQKLDPSQPAAWENSGLQTFIMSAMGRTSKPANESFTSLSLAQLPMGVCGDGWGVQQDKVAYVGSFTFPSSIQYPVDNIGWPPIYSASHDELSEFFDVPDCPPATAAVVVTAATCDAPATATLGAIEHATFGALTGATGPGTYNVTATADTGYTFADGTATMTLTGSLSGKLATTDPSCAPPPRTCLPNSAVSYTYDAVNNNGVITVAAGQSPEQELCRPFYVTSASWWFLDDDEWPQLLGETQKLGPISAPGVYEYGIGVECGQGDIYASFDPDDETLDPTDHLYGPDDPFDEHFLHQMGFTGPRPTYTVHETGCNELAGVVPTKNPGSCEAVPSYTLPEVEHVTWWVNGVKVQPGTYEPELGVKIRITALADEGWTIPGGEMNDDTHIWYRTWKWKFHSVEGDCATLVGSTAVGECVKDAAWITYNVTLTDLYDEATSRDATLTMTDGVHTVTIPLGTVPASNVLSGQVLWPGASVDPLTRQATGWPGWVKVGDVWQETSDPAYFGWTRGVTSALIQVNPELTVALSYPPATPNCADRPPEEPPTLGVFPTNVTLSEQCTTAGRGILTLGLIDGVSFFEDVNYFVDGVLATGATVSVAPGVHVVTVTTKNETDGLDGPSRWQVTVTGGPQCGELTTLALTGTDATPLLGMAALLGLLGIAAMLTARLRVRRIR